MCDDSKNGHVGDFTDREMWFRKLKLKLLARAYLTVSQLSPGGVLWISSDGDDRMEPKVKTQKNP